MPRTNSNNIVFEPYTYPRLGTDSHLKLVIKENDNCSFNRYCFNFANKYVVLMFTPIEMTFLTHTIEKRATKYGKRRKFVKLRDSKFIRL